MDWNQYQEDVAAFYRSMGLDAETNITVQGIRTQHAIDVVVKSHFSGFDITWIVECKYWKTKVSKLHVLALREIVSDTGVDRGILLSESGFQSGALEAAKLTNVHITSLEDVKKSTNDEILEMKLQELHRRFIKCKDRYWDIPKRIRIDYGLRQEVGYSGYSGYWVIEVVEDLLNKAFRGGYPIIPEEYHQKNSEISIGYKLPDRIDTINSLFCNILNLVESLESKLNDCETSN